MNRTKVQIGKLKTHATNKRCDLRISQRAASSC